MRTIGLCVALVLLVGAAGASAQPSNSTAAQGIALLNNLAASGDATAQCELGYAYDLGQGVPQDYTQAVAWYRKAAEQGNARAQSNLGLLYKNGLGVPQDFAQAAFWWRKAAEQGNARAQNNLGLLYKNGLGVPQDFAQAAFWIRKAAEQGLAAAQSNLGNLDKIQSENEWSSKIRSYWPTTIRVDTDMDSFWLPDEERTCQTYPNDKGRIAVVACNSSGSHRDHNIPVTFWGDPDRKTVSDWKCRRVKNIFSDTFTCKAID